MQRRPFAAPGLVRLSCAAAGTISVFALTAPSARAYFDCPPADEWCTSPDETLPAQCPMGSLGGSTMDITNGLPPGVALRSHPHLQGFFDISTAPGGTLGGDIQTFQCTLTLEMDGTSSLSGFHRTLNIPVQCQTHSASHTPGDHYQTFDTSMFMMQGQRGSGDPDFDLLRITAGGGFGMRSPGHTTLTRLPGGTWAIDSFFDITYRIDFVGHPGGPLGGMSGSTTGTIRMSNSQHQLCQDPPFIIPGMPGLPDISMPRLPASCPMTPPGAETMDITNGLPAGSSIHFVPAVQCFVTNVVSPGGTLGGSRHTSGPPSSLHLAMTGSGAMSSLSRELEMPIQMQCDLAQMDPLAPTQSLEMVMMGLQGQLPPGDRDFDLLRITGGNAFGLRSPGHTTLTRLPSGTWAVDSFFDITYRIDFVGRPGGPLGGMSGSTTGTIRMQQNHGPPFPQLHVPFGGLDHVAHGQVTLVTEPDPTPLDPARRKLTACCIGSSGEDGVEINLRSSGSGGGGGGGSGGSAQGHRCEIEWGPGSLRFGNVLSIDCVLDVLYPGDTTAKMAQLVVTGTPGGSQSAIGVSSSGFPVDSVDVRLLLHGEPIPGPIVTHLENQPPSPEMALAGFAAGPNGGIVVQHRLVRLAPGAGLPDALEITLTNPFDAVCSIPNEPTVTADQVQMTVRLNGLPPGTRYIGNRSIQIHGTTAGGMPPIELTLRNEHIILHDVAVRIRESPTRHYSSHGRVAVGDVTGDGVPDIVCSDILQNGPVEELDSIVLEADLDGDGEFEPLSSMAAAVRVGDDNQMPPNSALRASFFDVFVEDPAPAWVEARRCDDGSCVSTEMDCDFTGNGATTLVCRAYNGLSLEATVTGIPVSGVFAVVGGQPMGGDIVIHGTCLTSGALRCDWSWGTSNRTTIGGSGGGAGAGQGVAVVCNRLVIEPESSSIPIEMLSMDLRGSNICQMALTNVHADPVPECAADISPPGGNHAVNVNDLLDVIGHWGACPAPCPPRCPQDIVQDCLVNVNDLLSVISNWGSCESVTLAGAPSNDPPPSATQRVNLTKPVDGATKPVSREK